MEIFNSVVFNTKNNFWYIASNVFFNTVIIKAIYGNKYSEYENTCHPVMI